MRITQNIMHAGALTKYQNSLRQVAMAQERVSTGLRVQKPSDDPGAANTIMQAAGSLRAVDQYRRNINTARSRVDAEETLYVQLSDALVRAREIALSQAGDNSNSTTRQLANAEIEQLTRFAVQLANTKFSGSYLLGGSRADVAPVTWTDPNGGPPEIVGDPADDGHHRVEVSPGQYLETARNAREVFADTGIFQALQDLSAALEADDGPAILAARDGLEEAFSGVQLLIGDAGARSTQLQITSANLDVLELNLLTLRADVEEVDLEKAVADLVSRQTTFQAAMLSISRVQEMSLVNYLR